MIEIKRIAEELLFTFQLTEFKSFFYLSNFFSVRDFFFLLFQKLVLRIIFHEIYVRKSSTYQNVSMNRVENLVIFGNSFAIYTCTKDEEKYLKKQKPSAYQSVRGSRGENDK